MHKKRIGYVKSKERWGIVSVVIECIGKRGIEKGEVGIEEK